MRFSLLNLVAGICIVVVATFLGGAFYASLGHSDAVELGTVSGLVTLHGKPQPNMRVDFIPDGGGRGSEGRTDEQGRYRAIYTLDKAGALVGRQEVIVSVPEVLDQALNVVSPRKQLFSTEVEVRCGANELDFELAD